MRKRAAGAEIAAGGCRPVRHALRLATLCLLAVSLPLLAIPPGTAAGPTTVRVSVNASGRQVSQSSSAGWLSDRGGMLVMTAKSPLVTGDTNQSGDVYLKDLDTGRLRLVSVGSDEQLGNYGAGSGRISSNNRFVAFASLSTNFASPDEAWFSIDPDHSSRYVDVFVRDLQAGRTRRASTARDGGMSNGMSSFPWAAPDGSVVYVSEASDLVRGDTNDYPDVFLYDAATTRVRRLSVRASGEQFALGGDHAHMSGDGRWVAFTAHDGLYVTDRFRGGLERVNVLPDGTPGAVAYAGGFSFDGRYLVFTTFDGRLAPGGQQGVANVYVRDLWRNTTSLVATDAVGPYPGLIHAHDVSLDGRYVAISAEDDTLMEDTNEVRDAYVVDRLTQRVARASVTPSGTELPQDGTIRGAGWLSLSGSGRYLTFSHDRDDVVPGDTNGAEDVFLRGPFGGGGDALPGTPTRACPRGAVPPTGYTDTAGSPHRAAIACATWWELIGGNGDRYRPRDTVSRGHLAALITRLVRTAGTSLPTGTDAFSDDDGTRYERAINRLVAAGIIRDTGTRFRPEGEASRASAASMLVRSYGYVSGRRLSSEHNAFIDDDGHPKAAAIDAAAGARFVTGVDVARFQPRGALTRGVAATFLARTINRYVVEGRATLPR